MVGQCLSFKWIKEEDSPVEEDKTVQECVEFIMKKKNEQNKGYFLKVYLEYPTNLHDYHDTFPCAPEHLKIKEEFLSDYQKELGEKLGVKYGGKKLCLTLNDKGKCTEHCNMINLPG